MIILEHFDRFERLEKIFFFFNDLLGYIYWEGWSSTAANDRVCHIGVAHPKF